MESDKIVLSFDGKSKFYFDPETRQCRAAWFAGEPCALTLGGLTLEGDQPADDALENAELPVFKEDKDLVVFSPHSTIEYPRKLLEFMDPIVDHYGLSVPRWVFFLGLDHKQCKIDRQLYKAVAAHVRKWTASEPEVLGQLVGFLPWHFVEYQQDLEWDPEQEEWVEGDEFDNPLSQPFGDKQGDCEDLTRMMLLCFDQIPSVVQSLKDKYCCCALDTVIYDSGFHSMCVLIPWATLDSVWLPPKHRQPLLSASSSKDRYELPVLVIESTDRTRTEFARSGQRYDWFSEFVDRELAGVEFRGSFPFVDKSYRRQGYFQRFLTLYSPQLFQRTGVASWHILTDKSLGCTLDELVDQFQVHLEPRQSQVDVKQAQLFIDRCMPRLHALEATPSHKAQETKAVAVDSSKQWVPVYTSREELGNVWPQLLPRIVGEEEVLGQPVLFLDANSGN